jgi:hypothetical protein
MKHWPSDKGAEEGQWVLRQMIGDFEPNAAFHFGGSVYSGTAARVYRLTAP